MTQTADELRKVQAKFTQSRNDMHWSHWDSEDGFVRWAGYDDAYWWSKGSVKPEWQTRTMQSGRRYTLDPVTGDVFIAAAEAGE